MAEVTQVDIAENFAPHRLLKEAQKMYRKFSIKKFLFLIPWSFCLVAATPDPIPNISELEIQFREIMKE